jgi:hypothetical protein
MSMLRHIPTGDLYIATQYLSQRDDMEPVVEDTAVVEEAEKKVKRQPKAKAIDITDVPETE